MLDDISRVQEVLSHYSGGWILCGTKGCLGCLAGYEQVHRKLLMHITIFIR